MRMLACLLLLAACSTPQPSPAPAKDPAAAAAPAQLAGTDGGTQGMPCPDGTCSDGLECVKYFGVAGPRGPELSSCERRCSDQKPCPSGLRCTTIADGPGQVCR